MSNSITTLVRRCTPKTFLPFPVLLLLMACLAALAPLRSSAGTWSALTNQAPGGVSLMMLMLDGTVMCQNSGNATWYRLTPDIHGSYLNGTWSTVAPMHDSRRFYSSQVLKDGRLFVAGGEYGTGGPHAEVYDPLSNTWMQAPDPGHNLIDSISETLPNGNVFEPSLATGDPCLIYNIVSNTWSNAAIGYDGQDEAAWVKLPDSSILTIDPFGQNTERYIPALNQWVVDGTVPVPMYGYGGELGAGFLLPNGKVFYIGATNNTAIYTPTGTTNAGAWVAGPNIPNNLGAVDAPAAMMVNGNILCAVGTDTNYGSVAYFYEYNYVTNSFTQVTSPTGGSTAATSPYGLTMLDLPDGTVLLSGFGTQLYAYQPGGTVLTNGVPTILSVTTNLDGSFHVTGTLLNGISEGAAYGDDSQMVSDYPIARITNSTGNVLYCRTYNRSTCNVMTGTNVITTEMALPAGLLAGTYPLFVTANGISSAPYSLTIAGTPLPAVTGLAFSSIASNQMAFHWSAIGLTETGYIVQRSIDGTNYSTLTSLATNVTTYTDTAVSSLGQYYYRVMGTNSTGLGNAGQPIFAASPPVVAVVAPWQSGDVGAVQGSGAAGTNAGTFTVIGSGNGIGTDNDQFQFVYQPVAGDVIITARVVGNQNTGSNAMAGVMIRNSLGSDVAAAFMAFDGGAQASIFEHRADAAGEATYGLKLYGEPSEDDGDETPSGGGGGGGTTLVSQPASAPLWVRLVRSGNSITGYTSTDGTNWTLQGTSTLGLSPVADVGLAVTSGSYNQLNTSTFDNVSVTGFPALTPPPVAEWKLDETSGTTAEDSIDSFDGLYNSVLLGQPGATPDTGYSAGFNGTNANITLPPLNLNSNALTITAWVNRNGTQNAWSGILFGRGTTADGFHFGTANELRYTWNNNASTYNFNSGLVVPNNQWTFVALVIEPSRARLFMVTNGVLASATNSVANPVVLAFDGTTCIGQDSSSASRYFNGLLDDVQLFNQALTPAQLATYATAPVLTFSTPTNNQEFLTPANVSINASLTGTNGHTINLVQFFNNGTFIGQTATPPYTNTVTNLVSGTYTLSARLYYDSGLAVSSDPANVIVEPVPTVPQNVIATPIASNLVFVSWSLSSGADGYVLSRGGTPVASLSTTNFYLDSGLSGGVTYCYTVTATNHVGSSAASAASCALTPTSIATFTWDAGSSGTGPQDGNDNWGTGATTWWNGSAASTWTDGNLAVFGNGTATNCLVTLLNDVTPASIIFNVTGGGAYYITNSSGSINLSGTPELVVNGNATISATLKGAGQLNKTGPGTLTLTAANTNSGPVSISGGRVIATVAPWYSPRSIGSGALTVSNSAVAEFTGSHGFGADAGGRPATLANGGTLQFDKENYVSALTMTAGNIIGAGEIRTIATTYNINSAASNSLISCNINLINSVTINVTNGPAAVGLLVSGNIYGAGNFTKSGNGVLQLTGTATNTGTLTVSAGTLQLDGATGTNTFTIQNTATLTGDGVVNGVTTVQSGGTLAPGDNAIGSLFFVSSVTLNAGSKCVLKLTKAGGTPNNDLVSTLGTLTLGGTLTVTNIGTNALAAGDSFDLFNASNFGGSFTGQTLPALAAGLVWDTSQLAINGIITVAALPAVTVSPAATNIVYAASATLAASASGTTPLSYQWYDRNTNAIAGATNATFTLTAPGVAASGNYTVIVANPYGTATNLSAVTISPATLTVSANNTNRLYGAANPAFTASYTGFVNGDTTAALSGAPGLTTSAATNSLVGTYTIAASAGTLGAANYNFAFNSGTLTVSPAALTVTANNLGKTYGQLFNFAGTEFSATGLLNGDTVTNLTLASIGATNTAITGNYAVNASNARGTGLGNYTISYVSGTLTVNPASLTVSANNTNRIYGAVNPTFTASYSGFVNGDTVAVLAGSPSLATTATTNSAVGTYTITAGLGTLTATNYSFGFTNGTLTVNSAALTITANSTNKVYGQALTFAGTEFAASGLLNGDTVTNVALASTGATNTAAVGSYAITATAAQGTGLGNYTISYISGTLTVNTAALTITANSTNKLFGQTLVFAGTEFTSSGLLNSDTVTNVALASPGATNTAVAGTYPITAGSALGTGLGNYAISYVSGTLTVTGSLPTAPQNLIAQAIATNQISLTWSAVSNTTGYVVSSGGSAVANVAGTNYTDTGLAMGTPYTYTVAATNAIGSSPASAPAYATTPVLGATLTWDTGTSTNAQDGSGIWGTNLTTWLYGTNNLGWYDGNVAAFGVNTTTNCTVTLTNDVTPSGITFNATGGGSYTMTGTNNIWLTNSPAFVMNGSGTISTPVNGTGSLTESGTGTLTLTTQNSYSGGTVVNAGKLISTVSCWYTPRGIGSGLLTVNSGATAEFTATHGFGGDASGRPVIINNGTLQFDHENYVSSLAMAGGGITGAGEIRTIATTYYTYGATTNSLIGCNINMVNACTFSVTNGSSAVGLLVSGTVYGAGGLTKAGPGLLQLTGTATNTGATTVSAGTLQLDGSLGTNTVTVQSTATLSGTGTINGATTIQSGGTLAPGDNAIGTLTISNALTLAGNAAFALNKSGSTLTGDLVQGLGTVTYGGTLTVTATGTALAAGDTFTLFTATSYAGSFTSITLPSLGSGLAWNTNNLAVNGTIAVAALPVITTQPANQSVTQGSPATFSVTATGTALNYQWLKNGASIGGATAASYTISSTTTNDAASYSVVISNAVGSTNSATATLTVNVPPVITTQPVSQNINQGSPVTFSVTASGTAPLNYQWLKNGTNISGATSSSYTISSVATTDAANYTVAIANVAGSTNSSAATLTVNVPPTITTQPASQTVIVGNPVTFTVAATGTAPLSYQWQKNGANISGATTASYTIGSVATNDAANYTAIVTNIAGSVTSSTATLTVNAPFGDWHFDDGTGTVATDSAAVPHNGTVSGTNATWVTGIKGNALQFTGVSNYVAFGTGPSMSGTNNFTIAAWIKTTSTNTGVIMQQRDAANYNGEYRLSINGTGTVEFMLYGDGAYQFDFTTTNVLNNGVWHYVVAERNGLAGNIYLDGNPTPVATATGTGIKNLTNIINVAVGRDIRDNTGNFTGTIDEVKLYKVALSGADVSGLYNTYLGLVSPWLTADIGSGITTGSATQTNGVFTVQGAGNLSGTADNFRFVYQNMSGDAEIRARIPSYQNTGASGRLGVMMRDSLTANSMNAFMGIQVTNGTFYFQTRTSSGGATTSTSSGTGTAPNIWVRLVRSGTTLSGYKSSDGATWTLVSTNTFTMSTNCYFGLGVASGTTNTLNTATFDNLTVSP